MDLLESFALGFTMSGQTLLEHIESLEVILIPKSSGWKYSGFANPLNEKWVIWLKKKMNHVSEGNETFGWNISRIYRRSGCSTTKNASVEICLDFQHVDQRYAWNRVGSCSKISKQPLTELTEKGFVMTKRIFGDRPPGPEPSRLGHEPWSTYHEQSINSSTNYYSVYLKLLSTLCTTWVSRGHIVKVMNKNSHSFYNDSHR